VGGRTRHAKLHENFGVLRNRAISLEVLELPDWVGPPEARTCGGVLVYTADSPTELGLSCLITPLQILVFQDKDDVKAMEVLFSRMEQQVKEGVDTEYTLSTVVDPTSPRDEDVSGVDRGEEGRDEESRYEPVEERLRDRSRKRRKKRPSGARRRARRKTSSRRTRNRRPRKRTTTMRRSVPRRWACSRPSTRL